jgi:hypothetical protein
VRPGLTIAVTAYLGACLWLAVRRMDASGVVFARRRRWCLLLFLAVEVAAELFSSSYWFAPGALSFLLTGTLVAGAVALVWWVPAIAADLATAGLIALGAYGIAVEDLHDGAQARLVALGMSPRAAERLFASSPQAAIFLVAEAREASSKALAELRDLVRGTGLAGIERRLGTFDGILAVSSPPGGPTMTIMEVPCALSSPRTSSC